MHGQGPARARRQPRTSRERASVSSLPAAKRRARGRTPCMTQTREPAPDGREPFVCLHQLSKIACQAPVKISTRADPPHILATVLRSALSPPAKTGGGSALPPPKRGGRRRKERYFAPSGTLHDLPNILIGAPNAQYLTRRHEYGEAARNAGERGPQKVPEARRRRDPRPVAEGWQLFGERHRHPAGRGAGAKRPARRRPPTIK